MLSDLQIMIFVEIWVTDFKIVLNLKNMKMQHSLQID